MGALISDSVLPDANIWVSQTLHSWFGLIAAETRGSWHFYWTEDILAEAVYHRRRRFPRSASKQIEGVRDRLMKVMGESRISNFVRDSSVTVPDENDAHIHDAAVHAGIAIIVSENHRDFEGIYDDPDDCPYEVYSADDFLMLVADSAPEVIDRVLHLQYRFHRTKGQPFSLPKRLHDAKCPQFSEYVRERLQKITI